MATTEKPRRILVIDDNRDAANMIVEFLGLCGHVAVPVYDGASAVDIAVDFKPEVVFCDLGMPGMDGYQVAKSMRVAEALRNTKVVALTAWSDATARAKVIAAGFHFHLVKPATFDDILRQIP